MPLHYDRPPSFNWEINLFTSYSIIRLIYFNDRIQDMSRTTLKYKQLHAVHSQLRTFWQRVAFARITPDFIARLFNNLYHNTWSFHPSPHILIKYMGYKHFITLFFQFLLLVCVCISFELQAVYGSVDRGNLWRSVNTIHSLLSIRHVKSSSRHYVVVVYNLH